MPPDLRVGLVSFADTARSLVRPTTDHDQVRRHLQGLRSFGSSAAGEGVRRAVEDVVAGGPPGPVAILLLSDSPSLTGRDPLEAAAVARNIPVLAVSVGTPEGKLSSLGGRRVQAVPPDPVLLARIADATSSRMIEARSTPEVEAAVNQLARALASSAASER